MIWKILFVRKRRKANGSSFALSLNREYLNSSPSPAENCAIRPLLGTNDLLVGRDLYRATPAFTRGLGFCGLIGRTAPICLPFTTTNRYWGLYPCLLPSCPYQGSTPEPPGTARAPRIPALNMVSVYSPAVRGIFCTLCNTGWVLSYCKFCIYTHPVNSNHFVNFVFTPTQ